MSRFAPPSTTSCPNMALSKRLSVSILEPILAFWFYFSQKTIKASKRLTNGSPKSSPLAKPRKVLATLSHKTFNLRHKKKSTCDDEHEEEYDFGDGGLWQRSILMGDKCQPLDFSGVIYYDNDGRRMSELPMRSPARASPLPNYILNKKE
ncbi:hypothetical protein LIER_34733 [Lithospermum erythrorhizon]|uniref:Uncharacterized protein n=1 Tax=Lithospermum erythrorhizon TaxID=34254 RepID=A0AAV3S396_LITER